MTTKDNGKDLQFQEVTRLEKRHKHYLKKKWSQILARVNEARERGERGAIIVRRRASHVWMTHEQIATSDSEMAALFEAKAGEADAETFICIFVSANNQTHIWPLPDGLFDHGT